MKHIIATFAFLFVLGCPEEDVNLPNPVIADLNECRNNCNTECRSDATDAGDDSDYLACYQACTDRLCPDAGA